MKWLILTLPFLIYGGYKMSQPRGIRNKNPGNIRLSGDDWQGLSALQTDPAFFQFSEMRYGVRALAKLLLNYQSKYGLNTVAGIISRYAPDSENNTHAYIQSVSRDMQIDPYEPFNVRDRLPDLVAAIVKHENGQPIAQADIMEGVALV